MKIFKPSISRQIERGQITWQDVERIYINERMEDGKEDMVPGKKIMEKQHLVMYMEKHIRRLRKGMFRLCPLHL